MGLNAYSEAVAAYQRGDLATAGKKMAEALGADKIPEGKTLEALVHPGPVIDQPLLRQIQITSEKHGTS
jgi:hypothetical protein